MSDETWLTDEQQRVWRQYLKVSRGIAERIEGDMQRQAGIPSAYYLILAMLSEAPGRALRMNQLAEVLNSSQSRTSHAIARLEGRAGYAATRPARRARSGREAHRCRPGPSRGTGAGARPHGTQRDVRAAGSRRAGCPWPGSDKIDARLAAGSNAFVSQRLVPVK